MKRQFSSIFPSLFFITLFLLPLSRPPSHAFQWLLLTVLGIFLVNVRVWWKVAVVRRAFVGTLLFAVIVALAEASSWHLSTSLLPLVFFLASLGIIPVVVYVTHVCGRKVVGLVLLGMTLLWAQWGIGQFVVQADLGFNLAGESDISASHIGVAKFSLENRKILRAYGPFLHANTFGGVSLLGILFLFSVFLKKEKEFSGSQRQFFLVAWFVLVMALLTSFSRSAMAGAAAPLLIWLIIYRGHWRRVSLVGGIIILVFSPLLFFRSTDVGSAAVKERRQGLMWWKGLAGGQNSWHGTGLGGYSEALQNYFEKYDMQVEPWQAAPVHSVPLLAIAELGRVWSIVIAVFGLGFAIWNRSRFFRWFFLVGLPLLPALLLDHYFFTQPGPLAWLLVWVALASQSLQRTVLEKPRRQSPAL